MRLRTVCLLMLAAAAFAAAQAAGPPGSAASLESGSGARITRIAAAAASDGSAIEVTFVSSDPRRELLVFWGTAPMTAPEDLLRSTARAQLGAGTVRYAVPVTPGTDWWFAVLDARLYAAGGAPLVPGENATTRGVRMPAAAAEATAGAPHRGQPLPSLQLPVSVETGGTSRRAACPRSRPNGTCPPRPPWPSPTSCGQPAPLPARSSRSRCSMRCPTARTPRCGAWRQAPSRAGTGPARRCS